jgi:hypothetical protein
VAFADIHELLDRGKRNGYASTQRANVLQSSWMSIPQMSGSVCDVVSSEIPTKFEIVSDTGGASFHST